MKAFLILPVLLFSFLIFGATQIVSQLSLTLTGNGLREVTLDRDFDLNHCCRNQSDCRTVKKPIFSMLKRSVESDANATCHNAPTFGNNDEVFCFAPDPNRLNIIDHNPMLFLRLTRLESKEISKNAGIPNSSTPQTETGDSIQLAGDSTFKRFGFSYGSILHSGDLSNIYSLPTPESNNY